MFPGITLAALVRLHEAGGEYSLDLNQNRDGGTVRRPTPLGEVVVRFTHDRERAEMHVTIVSKPKLLPEPVLWAGVALALRRAIDPSSGKRVTPA